MPLSGQHILLTGGTGSFGQRFVEMTLRDRDPASITIYSRDEMKQWDMSLKFAHDPRVRFLIGDVRDLERLDFACQGMDVVVHAAATKIVPTAEYNPFECIKTNVMGAMNVIEATRRAQTPRIVALSTDKASNPINLYGASKLASDKLFVAANGVAQVSTSPTYSVVRYGNVMGSRGSVIPFFVDESAKGSLPITDPRMTRFMITLEQGVELVWKAIDEMIGGEIYVKKIPSMRVTDMAETIAPGMPHRIIGIRPGEKIHEQMIGPDDAPFTYEYSDHFAILPSIHNWHQDPARIKDGQLVPEGFAYTSDTNESWMSHAELRKWLATSGLLS